MKRLSLIFGVFVAVAVASVAEEQAPVAEVVVPVAEAPVPLALEQAPLAPPSVISRSKQFRVSGGSPLTRAAAAILAEQAKDDFLGILGEADAWKIPVAIVLHGEIGQAAPPRTIATRLWLVDGSYHLQLDKHLGSGIETESFRDAVTSVLIFARTIQAHQEGMGDEAMRVPVWLRVGLNEASAWSNQQSDHNLYATVYRQGGLFQLNDMFEMSDKAFAALDGATRAAYRVSAGSLVMALLEQPGGKQGFRSLLGQVALFEGEAPMLLRKHFPELNLSKKSLDKWWALQLANKGDMNLLTDVISIVETEDHLAKALFLDLPLAGGALERVSVDQWQRLEALDEHGRASAIKSAQAALVRISYRCFPSYRPLLVEYQKVLIRMMQPPTQTLETSLGELRKAREIMLSKAARGRDYLDWFEITRARETSGAFDDYLKLKEELKSQKRDRRDGISAYLDRLDEAFHREQQ